MSDQQNGANSNGWVDLSKESRTDKEPIVAEKAPISGANINNTIPEDYKKELEKDDSTVEQITPVKVEQIGGKTLPTAYEKELHAGSEKAENIEAMLSQKVGGSKGEELRQDFKEAVEDIIFGEGNDTEGVSSQELEKGTASVGTIQASVVSNLGGPTTLPKDYMKELEKPENEKPKEKSVVKTGGVKETTAKSEKVVEGKITASVASTTGGTTIPKKYREELNEPIKNDENPSESNTIAGEPEIIPVQVPVMGKSTIPPKYRENLNRPEERKAIPMKSTSTAKLEDAATKPKYTIAYRPSGGVSYQTLVILFVITGVIAASMVSKRMDEMKKEHLHEIEMWNNEHAVLVIQHSGLQKVWKEIKDKISNEQDEIKQDLNEKKHMFEAQLLRVMDGHKLKEEKVQETIEELEDEVAKQNRINKDKITKDETALKTWLANAKEKLMTQTKDTEQGKRNKKDSDKKKDEFKEDGGSMKALRKLKEDNLQLQYKLQLGQATACSKCPGKTDDKQHLLKMQEAQLEQIKREHKKEMEMRSMNHDGQNFLKRKYKDRFLNLLDFIKENEPKLSKN